MLDQQRLTRMHRYWCAANYLTVGQIYLKENPLLKEEHIKPRLLADDCPRETQELERMHHFPSPLRRGDRVKLGCFFIPFTRV